MGRAVLIGVLAFALLAVPAQAAEGAAKQRTCRAGEETAILKGRQLVVVDRAPRKARRVCLRRPRTGLAGSAPRAAAERVLNSPLLRSKRLKRAERSRAFRRLKRHLRRFEARVTAPAASVARAPSARASRQTQTSTTNIGDVFNGKVAGGKAELRTRDEAPDADETGRYVEADGEISIGDGKTRVAKRQVYGTGGFADRCPSAAGRVSGTIKFKLGEGLSSRAGGKSVGGDWSLSFESKLEGTVGDDGRLRELSYTGTAAAELRGTGDDGRFVSRVYRLAYSGGPVARAGDLSADWVRGWQTRAWGPRGDVVDTQQELDLVVGLRDLAHIFTAVLGREQLLKAEKHWYDAAECVELRFTPATGEIQPGGSLDATAAAHSRLDGSQITGDAVTLTSCGPGAVSPAAGTSSLGFTLTESGGGACVSGESVSRRGRGTGSASFTVPDVHWFKVTMLGRDEFTWTRNYRSELSMGTDSECVTEGSGSGHRTTVWWTVPGEAQVMAISGGEITTGDGAAMLGNLDHDGNYTLNKSGPGCGPSTSEPRDGCGNGPLPGLAELDVASPTSVTLSLSGPDPWDDLPACPTFWPGFVESDPDHQVSPTIMSGFEIALPMAELRDRSRPTVDAFFTHSESVTEFCSAAGSNNGGACGPEEVVSTGGTKFYGVRLTFTRIPPP